MREHHEIIEALKDFNSKMDRDLEIVREKNIDLKIELDRKISKHLNKKNEILRK